MAITPAMIRIDMMTTRVDVSTSSLDGQFTFFSSALDSFKKPMIFFKTCSPFYDLQ